MEEIKAPKKERKFLKAIGEVALTLLRDLLLGVGKKVINKVGNKRQGLAIALVMVAGVSYASIDSIPYPITGNKQKLGWQTTGNGLVYRGTAADTITKPSNYTNKDIKAYLLVDTVNNVMYSYIASKGGWKFNNSDTVIINNVTDTASLSNRINLKLNISDTASMLTNYLRTGVAASTYQPILVSGTNIKTVNSNSLLGSGNISVGTVTSVGGSGAISSSGGTTPVISVADAAFGTSGIVTSSGTQQFSGDKVFEGITQFNGRALFKDYTYTATRLGGLSSTDRFATVTIGTGLSLSSGTLSATGGGVTSVTASTPLSSSGGATPNITITDAGTGASGVVNTTTQSFAGNKTFTGTLDVSSTGTFGGRVKTNWLERNYAYSTSSSFTISVNTTWQDINTNVLTTLTLPSAATYPGKELHLRQTGTGNLQSASSNIIPFNTPPTGSTSTGILTASLYEAVTLVSDGTNWIIMQRSDN